MTAKIGWTVLAIIGGLSFAATAIGGSVALGLAISDGKLGSSFNALIGTGMVLTFWWWITLGAWARAHPDPDAVVDPAEQIGPWGVVGRALMMALVIVLTAVTIASYVETRSAESSAEGLRQRAEDVAISREVTAAQVAEAKDEQRSWIWSASERELATGQGPLGDLLPISDAEIVDASIRDGDAAVLIRSDDSPPCVVLLITASGLISSRTTADCD